jgi:hypothetical protein
MELDRQSCGYDFSGVISQSYPLLGEFPDLNPDLKLIWDVLSERYIPGLF